jgi:hypothetical protein
MPHRGPLGVLMLLLLLLLSPGASADRRVKRIPVAQVQGDEAFKGLLRKLAAFGRDRIGAIGGGPVMPGPDVLIAEKLTLAATREQLRELLAADNGAVRAHIAREIIRRRPAEVALVRPLVSDPSRISVGSMNDTPPIQDEKMTIGELIKRELAIAVL